MKNKKVRLVVLAVIGLAVGLAIAQVIQGAEPESKPSFNGKDVSGWKLSEKGTSR